MKKLLNKLHTAILLILAAGAPVLVVVPEQYWFEKRVALAGAGVVMLALWAARAWTKGRAGIAGKAGEDLGWGLLGAAMLVAAAVPAGRISNLMAPDLWAGLGAVVVYFAIKNMLTSSGVVKLGFLGLLGGLVVAIAVAAAGVGGAGIAGGAGNITKQAEQALQPLRGSPVWGEFREFRVARLGVLQVASGLGILAVLAVLALVYQTGLKSVKEIFKSSSIWWKALNLLVLVLLVGFLVLPHPALTLWPLAIAAALGCGITQGGAGKAGEAGTIKRYAWAGLVGTLVLVIAGSSYGLGRVVWGELKFREALAAANENQGIATYYALLEAVKRNPYEVRYHLLASQIDIALANSIAAQAAEEKSPNSPERGSGSPVEPRSFPSGSGESAATPSAGLTAQDRNNILILIQQAVVEGKAAIKLDPENSLLWQNLASIYRALIGVAGGAEDWALKSYQRAAELDPKDPNPPLQLGTIHFISGNFQGAVGAFEEATKIKSDWPLAHYNLAVVFNAMGEVDRAIEQLRETLALLPADSPDREQVAKDLEFLKGEEGLKGLKGIKEEDTTETEELKEATSSAEVEAPPPPVGPPEEATESAQQPEGPIKVIP